MPEATRQGVEDIKKGEIQKRKKVWEEKEGPAKKQKKLSAAREEKGMVSTAVLHSDPPYAIAALALEKEREAEKLAKAEAQRQAAEKKKKKPIRYPTEDLDVTLSEKERKNGMKVRRPVPSRSALPFNDRKGSFESFLMAWNFLIVYGCGLFALPTQAPDQCLTIANLCICLHSPWMSSSTLSDIPSSSRLVS